MVQRIISRGDDKQRREVHGFSKMEDDDADMEEWHWCPTDEDVQAHLKDGDTVVSAPAAVAGTPSHNVALSAFVCSTSSSVRSQSASLLLSGMWQDRSVRYG